MLAGRTVEQLRGGNEPDMPLFMPEMLTPFQLHDFVGTYVTHPLNVRQRKGIRFAADFHHQTAHYRQRQRHFQMETAALPRALVQFDAATQLANHVLNRVQTDASTGHLGDLVAHAEAG